MLNAENAVERNPAWSANIKNPPERCLLRFLFKQKMTRLLVFALVFNSFKFVISLVVTFPDDLSNQVL